MNNESRPAAPGPQPNHERPADVPALPAGPPEGHTPAQSYPAAPPQGQWVYVQAAPPKPPASGLRIAAGVLLILLGIVQIFSVSWFAFLSLFSLGTLATGIVLLCQTRRKRPGTARVGMWLASAAVVLGAFAYLPIVPNRPMGSLFLVLGIVVLVLLNKDWDRDGKAVARQVEEPAQH